MAVSLLAKQVSDICIGKPALRSLPASATVGDAVSALKRSGESFLSVWSCECAEDAAPTIETKGIETDHQCVGKVCMTDVVCFLCEDENLRSPASALQSPVYVLLPKVPNGLIRHLQSNSSLLEAIDLIQEGAQNLVVPIQSPNSRRKKLLSPNSTSHNGCLYCWLTHEDVVRFLLNSIAAFSPTSFSSIRHLNIIDPVDGLTVQYRAPASSMLPAISSSLLEQTSVAVIDEDGRLQGEISPLTIACCDERVAVVIATLSVGDLMTYIDCHSNPPEYLLQDVKARLEERNLGIARELMEEDELSMVSSLSSSSCSSSDDEFGLLGTRQPWSSRASSKMARGSEAIACYPWSSLVAVMVQALAHRVNYVWVVEDDLSLVGIVTLAGMLEILRNHICAKP